MTHSFQAVKLSQILNQSIEIKIYTLRILLNKPQQMGNRSRHIELHIYIYFFNVWSQAYYFGNLDFEI